MNIFKKIFVPSGQKETLKAFDIWVVRWNGRHGACRTAIQPEMEAFISEADALTFATQLKEAFKLTRNLSEIHSIVVENKPKRTSG